MQSTAIADLRRELAEVLFQNELKVPGIPTGIPELDALIPSGGVPRGRLSEVSGLPGSGTSTIVQGVVESASAQGIWVAYVDAQRTLAPQDWAHLGERDGVWMIRPEDPRRGVWCAEILLRSGAFGLVVLDGVPLLTRGVAVRLTRLAREKNAALVVASSSEGSASRIGGALRLAIRGRVPKRPVRRWLDPAEVFPDQTRTKKVQITVERGGDHRTVEVSCAIPVARRLSTHPEVPDRRAVAWHKGAARRGAGGSAGAGARRRPEVAEQHAPPAPLAPPALHVAVARARALG